jgi:hypothetical protein
MAGCYHPAAVSGRLEERLMIATRLSKSKFRAGLQCAKRLYLEIHARELATPFDEGTQAVLDAGTRVGELARARSP